MAKIIKKGHIFSDEYAENKCEHCGTVSELEFKELFRGDYGEYFFKCPYCGKISIADKQKYIQTEDIRINDIEFPNDFHLLIEDDIDLSDGKITSIIRDILKYLRENKNDTDSVTHIVDDTLFFISRDDDEELYNVCVAKNFYHTFVPYRGWDYITDIDIIESKNKMNEDCNNEDIKE